ncbi:ral guanine nucleotide dissociation stimulator-like isoform X3 [Diceros bicornis minor]|uniref:ral guanine nucleotide dissociation stimulator-like isoform X3 n=1 Tax=Diceros bicornis minor TaxID=77932 RepID=UPI0026F0F8D7|nr:ral guanine nucleotide dissociation stimulator-like isoform X3 [Diceros bicornis minor]
MARVQDQGHGRHGEGNLASLSLSLTLQEVSSVRATHKMDPQGAQERQQQQGSRVNFQKWCEKFKVIRRIQLLQQAANAYDLEPDERFGAWFQAMEPISVHESYWVSCRLEPAHQKASKMRLFRRKRNRTSSSLGPTTVPLAMSHNPLETTSSAPPEQQGHWDPRGAPGQLFPPHPK